QETRGFWAGIKRSFHRNIIAEKRYMLLWDGLKLTIYLSIWAALLGTVLGAGVCYLRMRKSPLLQRIAKTYIDLMRGTPILVLLLLMNYVVFANWKNGGIAVAIITFALNFAAYSVRLQTPRYGHHPCLSGKQPCRCLQVQYSRKVASVEHRHHTCRVPVQHSDQ
ncbi:MAG: ABC transporter permease subunit, partial [Bacteroidales bacterium]|nr:ABC transporter permease subunit [Bacteroidales bacterium]